MGHGHIPFVDREELLRDILTEIANGIAKNDCCLQWYMRFALNNGKESLAKQLCIQLERIKYGHKSKIAPDFPVQVAEQIGAIQLVECKSSIEEFELYVQSCSKASQWTLDATWTRQWQPASKKRITASTGG